LNILRKILLIPKCISKINNWQVAVLYYLGNKNEEKEIVLKDGTRCLIRNKSDAIAFFENFILEVNNLEDKFEIEKNDVVIDIGAHVGYFTLYAAKRAQTGMVISFEPTKESFSVLKNNVKINNFQNIFINNLAVANISESRTFFVDKKYGISNTFYESNTGLEKEIVQTTTLDEIYGKYNLENIDFLKMDCEGAEFEIILNTSTEILKKIKKISMEIHEDMVPHKVEELISKLSKNGFTINIKNSTNGIKMILPQLFAWR
jgi:FkbM family methyltransferase